ncbi:tRNA (adenosine(37)-N6)-dimethylallyltransferase MiaA [Pedobacter sp.]|nr:tRNA (adenosine(37)-N6)-dimethylallyltransferase MiaA [Candidatus Saccharibacteria bacterium]
MATIIPLLVIVGPTASGKSAVALDIAQKYGGEIIAADSRTVYRGVDIGTAKPSRKEQAKVPHHLIDVVEPNEPFTLWDFQQQAKAAIADIRSRGKLPILVGGTGLYVDSIIFDYELGEPSDPKRRALLELETIESLQSMLKKQQIDLPKNDKNKRHLIRAIEQGKINNARKKELIDHCIVVGIATDKSILDKQIRQRIKAMLEGGVVDEARTIAEQYGWDSEALSGNIYRLAHAIIDSELTSTAAVEKGVILDRRLAKRQRTWFKRNDAIVWNDREGSKNFIVEELHRLGIGIVLR